MNHLTLKSRSWWKYEWKVFKDSQEVGEMMGISKWSLNKVRAKAESYEWTLSTNGWNYNKIIIQDSSGATIATTSSQKWWRDKIDVEIEGAKYTIESANWYSGRYIVRDVSGSEVLSVRTHWWRASTDIDISNFRLDNTTIYLLSFIAFYRAKLMESQASAAS